MSTAAERVLRSAAASVFEGLCFATVEERGAARPPRWDVVSRVRFSGAGTGHLVLRLGRVDVQQLASAMLGDDGEIDDRLMFDAVGELTNVLCGNVLPRVAGKRVTFDLRHPEVGRHEPVATADGHALVRVLLAVDDGVAEVELALDPVFHQPAGAE